MTDAAVLRARLERAQRQQHERNPFHEDAQRPADARELSPAGGAGGKRADDEQREQRIVVPAAREMDGEQRVPADEHECKSGAARQSGSERSCREHAKCRDRLVDPCGCIGGRSGRSRQRLRAESEGRPVNRRRVAPVGADEAKSRIVRELVRLRAVRICIVNGSDATVGPVGPGVGREKQRRAERHELHRARDHRNGRKPRRRPACEQDAADVCRERGDEQP